MKKRVLTTLAVGGLCAVCLIIGACAATAVTEITQITAELRPDFTIVIDGQERTFQNVNGETVEPVLYQGTTYLPVRAIGELMGKDVIWYEDQKKIELKDKNQSTVTDADVIVPSGETAPQTSTTPQPSGGGGGGAVQPSGAADAQITADQAKAIALKKAGLTEDQVRFDRVELDWERGRLVYEIEFRQGRTEYTADVAADTGEIFSWEVDQD